MADQRGASPVPHCGWEAGRNIGGGNSRVLSPANLEPNLGHFSLLLENVADAALMK